MAKQESIDTLAADPKNPRRISDDSLAGLSSSMQKFGDVAGVVWNKRTGHLVTGHQRVNSLREAGAAMWTRDADFGYIEHPGTGEKFLVRIVDWDEKTERAANLTANNPHIQGEFTEDALAQLRDLKIELPEFVELKLDGLVVDLELPPETSMPDDPEPSEPEPRVCPHCGKPID